MAITELEYDEILAIADEIELHPYPSMGQYFTHDPDVVRRIASTYDVRERDHVLQIGAGMGAVTLALLRLGARVDAVEINEQLARQLPQTVAAHVHSEINRLSVVSRDVLKLRKSDVSAQPTVALVSLPHDVATAAVLHLLDEFPSLRSIVAVVESAAARWQATKPGTPTYDASVAKLRYLADMRECGELPPSAFWPTPRRAPDLVRLDRLD